VRGWQAAHTEENPMAQAFRFPESRPETSALEERLRTSLRDARGNLEIRRRLITLARDPARIEALVRELGPTHALLRDLRRLAAE
jgi:hypothetical protein